MKNVALLAAISVFALTGCAGSEQAAKPADASKDAPSPVKTAKPTSASKCISLDDATIASISEGLKKKASVERGFAVKLGAKDAQMKFKYIAALEIKDATGSSTAYLAMGAPKDGGGPWVDAEGFSRLYLTWGDAATKGSPIYDAAKTAWLSDAGKAAGKCL